MRDLAVDFSVNFEGAPYSNSQFLFQEEFKGMRDLYYKKGEGFVLVFSVGVTSSLGEVTDHYEEIKKATVSNFAIKEKHFHEFFHIKKISNFSREIKDIENIFKNIFPQK